MEPTIYLLFNGDCFEAMSLYAKVLGGEILDVTRNGDAPSAADRMPGGDELVMNLRLKLGQSIVMGSDCPEGMYEAPQGFSVSIAPASFSEFDRLYRVLGDRARLVTMPPCETFWADRFAMFVDRFGTPWMLIYAGRKADRTTATA
jgi:PhnB protein